MKREWFNGLALVVLWLQFASASATTTSAAPCSRLPLEPALEYRVEEFLLQYDLKGVHALENQNDSNGNKVPDLIEDVGTQLLTMKRLMSHFKFEDPLKQPRYQSQSASVIQVRFLKMAGNGLAFDEVRRNRHGECALLINLSSKLGSRNLSPAHEWFHLVQYGYTPFKRPWFLEGMARWSESALRKDVAKTDFGSSARKDLFAQSYDAHAYWLNLAMQAGEQSQHDLPPQVLKARYLNGEPVVQDKTLHGPETIRRALEALANLGESESRILELNPYHWPEATQRLPEHDLKMKAAIENSATPQRQ